MKRETLAMIYLGFAMFVLGGIGGGIDNIQSGADWAMAIGLAVIGFIVGLRGIELIREEG